MNTVKTIIFFIAASIAVTACNNATQNTQPVETQTPDETPIDSIAVACDTVLQVSFAEYAQVTCGLNIFTKGVGTNNMYYELVVQ